jgi:hypothetical protein
MILMMDMSDVAYRGGVSLGYSTEGCKRTCTRARVCSKRPLRICTRSWWRRNTRDLDLILIGRSRPLVSGKYHDDESMIHRDLDHGLHQP